MTRAEKLYDAFMRLPAVLFELFVVLRELRGIRSFVGAHPYFGGDWLFLIALTARISLVIFLVALAVLLLSRYRPVQKYESWSPKFAALAGMLLIYAILLTPRAQPDLVWDGLSTVLTLGGSTLAMLAALDLGRSLSVMPEARRLVVRGLYGRIRHPLYLAEEIATLGFFLQFRSWQAAAIMGLHFYFQLRRMHWEEGILARTFSEYADYKRRTFRLVPGVY